MPTLLSERFLIFFEGLRKAERRKDDLFQYPSQNCAIDHQVMCNREISIDFPAQKYF